MTCDAIIGAAIDQARRAEQEPGVEEMAGNVDTNGGNLNVPATEESELAATMAELVPEATVQTATESPEDGGTDVEGAGKRSAERLLNVGRIVAN